MSLSHIKFRLVNKTSRCEATIGDPVFFLRLEFDPHCSAIVVLYRKNLSLAINIGN